MPIGKTHSEAYYFTFHWGLKIPTHEEPEKTSECLFPSHQDEVARAEQDKVFSLR